MYMFTVVCKVMDVLHIHSDPPPQSAAGSKHCCRNDETHRISFCCGQETLLSWCSFLALLFARLLQVDECCEGDVIPRFAFVLHSQNEKPSS